MWRYGCFPIERFQPSSLKGPTRIVGVWESQSTAHKSRATVRLGTFLLPKKNDFYGVWLASFAIPVVPTTSINKLFLKHVHQYVHWLMKFQLRQAISEQIWVCGKCISESCNNCKDTSYSSENSAPHPPRPSLWFMTGVVSFNFPEKSFEILIRTYTLLIYS